MMMRLQMNRFTMIERRRSRSRRRKSRRWRSRRYPRRMRRKRLRGMLDEHLKILYLSE